MGVKIDWENNKWSCVCGSCGRHLGPYNSEEELRDNMNNWSYAFSDDIGNSRCPNCVQAAFEALHEVERSNV